MSLDRRRTTALVERIARVREAQAKQRLGRALAHEGKQRSLAKASAARLEATEQALITLLAGGKLDLLRTGLYQDLANAQQITLVNDRKALKEREDERAIRADELTRKTHYRDGASVRAREAARACQLKEERKEVAELIESWILRGPRSPCHE